MERNSGKDELNFKPLFINGKPIRRNLIRKYWSKIAKECYKRGCNCNGCDIIPPLESLTKCQIKYYVMGYIKLGYYPQTKENNDEE